ncbi:hypothetical protein BO068_005060 [Escherichia coli]|nr:hypothetical protein [Escherichia coli]EFG8200308.1 hypothetical protein [Escherichia coli]
MSRQIEGLTVVSQKMMFNRMISHFADERKAPAKTRQTDPLNNRYVESLAKLYARVYSI